VAVDRQDAGNDPRSPGALYELSTDGSNKLRKVFDMDLTRERSTGPGWAEQF
jgi:hypothetical protein